MGISKRTQNCQKKNGGNGEVGFLFSLIVCQKKEGESGGKDGSWIYYREEDKWDVKRTVKSTVVL